MSCDYTMWLEAWHDGELSGADAARVEAHVQTCAACKAELAQLQRSSSWLSGARLPAMSAEARRRLHAAAQPVRERGILRLAEWLTGAAAAALVVGLVGLSSLDRKAPPTRMQPVQAMATPASWEQAMLTLDTNTGDNWDELMAGEGRDHE